MDEKEDKRERDPIPESFNSLEEAAEFWDTHDTADYEDLMEEVEFEVDLRGSEYYYAISKDLVVKLRETARQYGVSTETLINLWLQEKLTQTTPTASTQTVAELAKD